MSDAVPNGGTGPIDLRALKEHADAIDRLLQRQASFEKRLIADVSSAVAELIETRFAVMSDEIWQLSVAIGDLSAQIQILLRRP